MTFLCSVFKVAPTRQDHKALALQRAQFPLCARCTGELAGILLAAVTWAAVHPGAGSSFWRRAVNFKGILP